MKKILSLFLSFVMLITVFNCGSGFAFAEDIVECTHEVTHEEKTLGSIDCAGSIDTVCDECSQVVSSKVIYPIIEVKLSKTQYTYNGKTQKPTVYIENSIGERLTTKNYTASFPTSSVNAGAYKVSIEFKNDYSGSKTLSYKILPSVSINKSTIAVGEKATVTAKGASKYTYRSSNTAIATVSSSGAVTGKKVGTAYIYAKANNVENKVKVTVKNPSIDIPSTASVRIKNSITLKKTSFPSSAKVTWSTSDKKIATVSSTGKVTGVKKGTATITAKITYNGKTYKDTCKVTVKNPALNVTSKTMYNSGTLQLEVNGGSGKITYSTSDKAIATVSSSGKVKALKKGKCTITAKRNGVTMKCEITVSQYNTDFRKIPDLGAMVGVARYQREYQDGIGGYAYKKDKVEAKDSNWKNNYIKKLKEKGFEYYTKVYQDGIWVYIYMSNTNIVVYSIYEDLIVIGMGNIS